MGMSIPNQILSTVYVDGTITEGLAKSAKIKSDAGRYYSRRLEGASVELPEDWGPGESLHLIFKNLVMGLVSADGMISASIRHFSADSFHGEFSSFYSVITADSANRGFFPEDNMEDLETVYLPTDDNSVQLLSFYPNKVYTFHIFIEYEESYYLIELISLDNDADRVLNVLSDLETFTAPGNKVYREE